MKRSQQVQHVRLGDHVAQVRAVEPVAHLHDALEVDVALGDDALGVDLEDLEAADLVGQGDLDLAVEAAGAQERRVEGVGPVRGHDDLGLAEVVEAVELVEELHERPLDLAVSAGALREPAAADRVYLVHEDDARLVLLRVAEHLADQARGFADIFIYDGRRYDCTATT